MIEGRIVWGFVDGMLEMKKAECVDVLEFVGIVWKMIDQMHVNQWNELLLIGSMLYSDGPYGTIYVLVREGKDPGPIAHSYEKLYVFLRIFSHIFAIGVYHYLFGEAFHKVS